MMVLCLLGCLLSCVDDNENESSCPFNFLLPCRTIVGDIAVVYVIIDCRGLLVHCPLLTTFERMWTRRANELHQAPTELLHFLAYILF